ncbi:MAG: response regulator [Desulfobacteraceae bacterium]|nr:response regulator [Desulfobacteraceae bacterium]
MLFSNFLPKKFSTRLIAMTFISGLIPIIIFALLMNLFGTRFPVEINRAIQHGQDEQKRRSESVLKQMAENFIRHKAMDVALQLELYLHAYPAMTLEQLQNDPKFRQIAIQPVGKKGYTAVFDSDSAVIRFHKNPSIENLDLYSQPANLPDFLAIVNASLGGKYSHGFYQWEEPDKTVHEKYMHIAPAGRETADGVRLSVAATTYLDEFTSSVRAAQDVSQSTSIYLMGAVTRVIDYFKTIGFLFMGSGIVIILLLAVWSGIFFSRAVTLLKNATKAVNQGDFDVRIQPVMSGDVGELAEDFNKMLARLAVTTVKKEQLEASEEKLKAINKRLRIEINEREWADEALKKAHNSLEKRVDDRTMELREANKKLLAAKNAADAVAQAKSDFLANMSHEIRTPLNGVITAADLALNTESYEEINTYLKIIHSSGCSLLGVINDILDFSKIEAGKLDLEIRPFRLDELLDRLTGMFVSRTNEKNIELLADIDTETPVSLVGDPLRLRQILTNLLSNAVKFTEKGGIYIGITVLKKNSDRAVLKFIIKDTGIGIQPGHFYRLFQPFTQADASTTRKYGGTGLGLCICKQLVELMNGKIWVESEPDRGSSFIFILSFECHKEDQEEKFVFPKEPLKPGSEERYIADPADKDTLCGIRVLVAEDNPTNRDIIKAVLKKSGIIVEIVNNGKEAVQAVNDRSFDAVLMDVQMPEMDGYEATRKIRALKQNIPVIAITAHAMKGDEKKCLEAGMDGYISKPINQAALFDTLCRLVNLGEKQKQTPGSLTFNSRVSSPEPYVLPIIDIQKALSELGINIDAYKNILAGFNRVNRDIMVKIRAVYENRDYELLTRMVHSLKGSAGNIRAYALCDAAMKLENASSQTPAMVTDDMVTDLETCLNQVSGFADMLISMQKIKTPAKKTDTRPGQLKSVLEKLAVALDNADPVDIENNIEILKQHVDISIIQDVENHAENYEYDEAMQTLKEIADRLDITLDQ